MKVGYARVSTDDQSLALQLDALKLAGCDLLFEDQGVSGSSTSRPALNRVLSVLKPGDTLLTWKLDRLGRSLAHLIALTSELEQRGVGFVSLSEASIRAPPADASFFMSWALLPNSNARSSGSERVQVLRRRASEEGR